MPSWANGQGNARVRPDRTKSEQEPIEETPGHGGYREGCVEIGAGIAQKIMVSRRIRGPGPSTRAALRRIEGLLRPLRFRRIIIPMAQSGLRLCSKGFIIVIGIHPCETGQNANRAPRGPRRPDRTPPKRPHTLELFQRILDRFSEFHAIACLAKNPHCFWALGRLGYGEGPPLLLIVEAKMGRRVNQAELPQNRNFGMPPEGYR